MPDNGMKVAMPVAEVEVLVADRDALWNKLGDTQVERDLYRDAMNMCVDALTHGLNDGNRLWWQLVQQARAAASSRTENS